MSYEDACTARISRTRARAEIERHHCDFSLFIEEVGDCDEYLGSEVLNWLGY
ncbi:hypothetical protein BH10PSE18_BH10PSE18_08000 [soil metagenome]